MIASRRNFLFGVGASIITAPAIVRVASLMPVKALPPPYGRSPAMAVLPDLAELKMRIVNMIANPAYLIAEDGTLTQLSVAHHVEALRLLEAA